MSEHQYFTLLFTPNILFCQMLQKNGGVSATVLLQIVYNILFMFGTMLMHTKLYVDVNYARIYIDAAYICPLSCQLFANKKEK